MTKQSTPNQLGGQAAFFLVGNIFTLVVGLPLQIYVARVLGASNLGVFSLIEGGVGLASGLIGFGLAPTLVKFLPQHLEKQEYPCIKILVRRGALILLGAGLIVYGGGWVALPYIEFHWPQLKQYYWAVVLMGLTIPIGILSFYLGQGLRGFQEIRYMVVGSSFLQLTVKAALVLLFLSLGFELFGYIAAVVISMSVALLWFGVGLLRKIKSLPKNGESAEKCISKPWVRYASIMYGGSLIGLGTRYLDRFLIGIFAGANAVGVLAIVKQLQLLPGIFLQMLLAVAAPMFSAAHARNDAEQRQHIYHLTTDWVLRASLPLLMFFMIFSKPILNLYGEEFVEHGFWPLLILIGAQLVNILCGPGGNLMNMSGLEGLMFKINSIQSVMTAIGLLVVVPKFGLIGVAYVSIVVIVIQNLVVLFFARKYLALIWWDRRYLKWVMPTVTACTTGLVLLALEPRPGPFGLVVCLVVLYVVFHGVSLLQGLHEDDRELLSHLLDKLKGKAA